VIILEKFGVLLGIPFLFLDPEYLHQVSWLSFCLMGIGFAIFTMAFHMTVYILEGRRFMFLAVVKWPFIHFCINNSIIPLLFYLLYTVKFISFQLNNGLTSGFEVGSLYLGFVFGSLLAYALIFGYFGLTNKNFFLLVSDPVSKKLKRVRAKRKGIIQRIKIPVQENHAVLHYLNLKLRSEEVKTDISRFDAVHLLQVFNQNHFNLFLIQVFLIAVVLVLGIFKENEFFSIEVTSELSWSAFGGIAIVYKICFNFYHTSQTSINVENSLNIDTFAFGTP
jgi:hypothetical protein